MNIKKRKYQVVSSFVVKLNVIHYTFFDILMDIFGRIFSNITIKIKKYFKIKYEDTKYSVEY